LICSANERIQCGTKLQLQPMTWMERYVMLFTLAPMKNLSIVKATYTLIYCNKCRELM